MNQVLALDVSSLPKSELDHRSTVWWGNVLLLIIETMMFALLVSGYFYVRPNFSTWPPPQVSGARVVPDPVPDLNVANINLVVLVLSGIAMLWADRAALHRKLTSVKVAVVLTIGLSLAAIWLRFHEFQALKFSWDENAYASIIWTLLGLHLLHLVVGTAENLILATWLFLRGMDDKHARDVRVGAVYWYWVVAVWVILYAIVFIGPRYF